jgi:3-phytase
MILLSRFPIDTEHARTFTRFRWNHMPGAMLPTDPTSRPWYNRDALGVLRLCSRSAWDVPVQVGDKTVHILASQPSSPLVEGAMTRVLRRNHDEVRLWSDYITGGSQCSYLTDDVNGQGRSTDPLSFVLLGDFGIDPLDGPGIPGTMDLLLKNPQVNSSVIPASAGAADAAKTEGGNNGGHKTPAQYDTADLPDVGNGPGNLRCDYVLPSKDLKIKTSGVYWPTSMDAQEHLATTKPLATTQPLPAPVHNGEHRLVWLDLQF